MQHLIEENFLYQPQQPQQPQFPSTFGHPTAPLVPDLTQPIPNIPPGAQYSNVPFFPPTPQWPSGLFVGSPPVNTHDVPSGFSPSWQATDLHPSPLYVPEDTYLPLFSDFERTLAEARRWMQRNPGQKVKSEKLEDASRQVNKHTWECLGCGETRKRREQVATHIRSTHLDNRGFYHCDEPGWYATLLHSLEYLHPLITPSPLALCRSTHRAT